MWQTPGLLALRSWNKCWSWVSPPPRVPHDAGLVGRTEKPCGLEVRKIKERLAFHLREALRRWHSSHPLFAETKRRGYQCGGNDFFWNPSLTELTERSFFDERRVKNASHRVTMPESVIDYPWQRLPSWCCETVAFPLLIQKIKPDNSGDLFTLLGFVLEVGGFPVCTLCHSVVSLSLFLSYFLSQ